MDRLTFFKQGLSSAMDAVSAVVGLKKAVNTFTEAVDEALGDIKSDMGLYLKSVESDMYEGVGSTLKEMARMGYTTIETDSYFGGKIYDLKPDDFRRAADEAGAARAQRDLGGRVVGLAGVDVHDARADLGAAALLEERRF